VIDSYVGLFLLAWLVAASLLVALYLRQRRTRDATAVDIGWATSIVLAALLYGVLAPGSWSQRLLICSLAVIENGRIAWLVHRRSGADEDTRYRELRERWRGRGREQLTFAIFYQAQAFVAVVLSLPILLGAFNRSDSLGTLAWAGLALWLAAASLEAVADRQLAACKADPANRGTTMRTGLWRYSRHPNYFFQTLTWVAYAVIATAAPWGWLGWIAPALILYLVLFVTGVPPAEEQSLRSRGDDYRGYQRETSVFVPWFPRSSSR
jgi:steroid 5-alpha reductase family enzyme